MNTSTSPSNSTPAAQSTAINFGTCLNAIAASFSLAPLDAAVGVATMLGNVAGPLAGLKDSLGRRITPGLNLLRLPGNESRVRALMEFLLHPVRSAQRSLREHAGAMLKTVLDSDSFAMPGIFERIPAGLLQANGQLEKTKRLVKSAVDILENGFNLPPPAEDPGPTVPGPFSKQGAFYRPTVLLEGVSVDHVSGALAEVLDHCALLLDAQGTVLGHALAAPKSSGEALLLLSRLLEGCDMNFPKLHKEQAGGTMQHAQIRLWSAVSRAQVTDLLLRPDHKGHRLLNQSLLWAPQSLTPTARPAVKQREQAWERYHHAVYAILQARAGGRGPVLELQSDAVELFAELQDEFNGFLDDASGPLEEFVAVFHDLPEKLLWAFLQLRRSGEPFWCVDAAFQASYAIVHRHWDLIKELDRLAREQATRRSADRIRILLRVKGPLKTRDIARSSNGQRLDQLLPGLEQLMSAGEVVLESDGRFRLNGRASPTLIAAVVT